MIHPDLGQQQAIENAVKNNPTVKFLFHGDEIDPYIDDLMSKYTNAYYSIDTQLVNAVPHIANLYGAKSKEQYLTELEQNKDEILSTSVQKWKPRIEQHPDRFVWGTDRAYTWHFDPEVTAAIDEVSRKFIDKLDPAVQAKFAYKNAEKLLQDG